MSRRVKYSFLNVFLTLVLVALVGFGVTKSHEAKAGFVTATFDQTNSLIKHDSSTGEDELYLTGSWSRDTLPASGYHQYLYIEDADETFTQVIMLQDTGYTGTWSVPYFSVSYHDAVYDLTMYIWEGPSPTAKIYQWMLAQDGNVVQYLYQQNEEIDVTDNVDYPSTPNVVHNNYTEEDEIKFNIVGYLEDHYVDEHGYKIKYYVNGDYAGSKSISGAYLNEDITVATTSSLVSHDYDGYEVTAELYACRWVGCTSPWLVATSGTATFDHPIVE